MSSWACTTISCKTLYLSFWHSWQIDAEIEHIRQTAADPSSNKNNNNWSKRILLCWSPLMEQSTYRTTRQLFITVNFQEAFKNCFICMCSAESLITWIHYVHLRDVLDMRRRHRNACIIIIIIIIIIMPHIRSTRFNNWLRPYPGRIQHLFVFSIFCLVFSTMDLMWWGSTN